MKTKKILFLLVGVLMLLSSLYGVYAGNGYSVNVVSTITEEKDEVKIGLNIDEATLKIVGMQGTIEYNKDILELKEVNTKKDNYNVTALNKENGTFMVEINDEMFYEESAYLQSGDEIVEAIFDVKDQKNTDIKISEIKMVNSNFETFDVEDVSEKIALGSNMFTIIVTIFIIVVIAIIIVFAIRKIKK